MANSAEDRSSNSYLANHPDIEIDHYYDKVHRTTWIRRVAGMMTGITIFSAFGAIGGTIAAFAPYVLGALGVAGAAAVGLPGAAAIATSAAMFAGAFALLGMVVGTDVGVNAGSVAAGLSKKERREALEQGKDISALSEDKKEPIIYMPRVALFTVPMGAAFGALLAFTGLAPAVALLGFAAGTSASVAASAITFGLFGASIGFNTPMFSNKLNNFYSRLITDRVLVPDPTKPPAHTIDIPLPAAEPDCYETPYRDKPFASEKLRTSIRDPLEKKTSGDPIPLLRV